MKMVAGTFNGTGTAVYLCIGFTPDWVRIFNLEDGITGAELWWSKQFRAAEVSGGILNEGDGTDQVAKTKGQAIAPYEGGDLMTTANQTDVTYGGGIYLGWDNANYAQDTTYGCGSDKITTWTLGSAGSCTGNWNEDTLASGVTRIGEGSLIRIRETVSGKTKEAFVEAVTAGQGEGANEVTLSRAIKSGVVEYISGMYSLKPIPIGQTAPAGFYLALYTLIGDNDEINYFEAGLYD